MFLVNGNNMYGMYGMYGKQSVKGNNVPSFKPSATNNQLSQNPTGVLSIGSSSAATSGDGASAGISSGDGSGGASCGGDCGGAGGGGFSATA